MVLGILIPASDRQAMELVALSGLRDYQTAVGGWIEAIEIAEVGVTLYVNESGWTHRLPFNRRATHLWWFHNPAARGHARLVGDSILVGLPNAHGDSTDIPTLIGRQLLDPAPHVVSYRQPGDQRWHFEPAQHDDYIEAVIWATLLMGYSLGLATQVGSIK